MGAKIAAFLLTMTACVTAAVISLSVMIIAMNGYTENDAMYGLGAFLVLAGFLSIAACVGAVLFTSKLLTRQFTTTKALLIAVPLFSIAGIGFVLVSAMIGIGVAEFVRVKF